MSLFSKLFNEKFPLTVSCGNATYKMNRGSFKTKDHTKDKHTLTFVSKSDNVYLYSDGKVDAKMMVIDNGDFFSLSFEVDKKFNRFEISFNSYESERIYGCGEQYSHLNLKGQTVNNWVSEHHLVKVFIKKFFREKLLGPKPRYVAPYKYHQTYYA